MQKTVRYFISGNRAYRSEIELFRQERLTADRCMTVKAPGGLKELYVVQGKRGAVSAWSDGVTALKMMLRCNGRGLIAIPVF